MNATADTPDAGTPTRPAICTVTVLWAATKPAVAPKPVRVSNTRAGRNFTNAPGVDDAVALAAN